MIGDMASYYGEAYPEDGKEGEAVAIKKKSKGTKAGDILRDEVPDSDVVPDGGYLAKIASMDVGETGNNAKTPGCKMFKAQYSIVEPKEYKGIPLFDNFTIGNEDDPDALKPSTWKASRGAKALKRLLTAAQVPLEGEEDELCEAAKGQTVFLVVVCQTQEEGEYKGVTQNRIRGYYAEGEREPEVTGEVPTSSKKGGVKAALKKKRVVEEDEDEEEEEDEKPVKKKKAVVEEDEDEDEDEEEEEEKPKRGRPKGSKNKKPAKEADEDDEDDEDAAEEEDEDEDDEEEEERPAKKRRA